MKLPHGGAVDDVYIAASPDDGEGGSGLPGMKGATKQEKYEKIKEKKIATKISDLCNGYAPEFAQYLYTVRELNYLDKPPYENLRTLFHDRLISEYPDNQLWKFDWTDETIGANWCD